MAGNGTAAIARLYDALGLGDPPAPVVAVLGPSVGMARFAAGAVITEEEGEVSDSLFLIRQGEARLERSAGGITGEVARLGPGDLVGEALVLLGDAGQDRVVATTAVDAFRLSRAHLAAAAAREPAVSGLSRALELLAQVAWLRAATPLGGLPRKALAELAASAETAELPAGAVLVRHGELPDRLAVIRTGRAVAYAGEGDRRRPVAELLPGDSLGEGVLLGRNEPAALTVEAATPMVLCLIDPVVLERLQVMQPESGTLLEQQVAGLNLVAFLRRSRPFGGLDSPALHRLAAAMRTRTFPPGAEICREGDPGLSYFLVVRGSVLLDVDESEGVRELDTAGPGDGFGEGAVATGQPYTYTAIAREETEVLELDRAAFRTAVSLRRELLGRVGRTMLERQLPVRIRKWSAVRQETAEGEALYILKDEERGRYYKLSERGYYLWGLMDGNTSMRDLIMAYFIQYKSLSMEQVGGLVEGLRAAGFVRTQAPGMEMLGAVKLPWPLRLGLKLRSLLDIKVAIPGCDPAVSLLWRCGGRLLYTRPVQLLMAALAATGPVLCLWLWATGRITSMQIDPGWGWLRFYGFVLAHAVVHEMAHALTVKAWGGEVRHMGFGLFWGTPILYVDTSDIWMASRRARIMVSWAGPYFHLLLASALSWLVLLVPGAGENRLLVYSLTLNWLFCLGNLFPLLEFDGYYMLMDYLEIPSLRRKALGFLRAQAVRWKPAAQWTRVERIYAGFGVVSLLYSTVAILQIVWFAQTAIRTFLTGLIGPLPGAAAGWASAGMLVLLLLWPAVRDLRRTGVAA